MEIINLSYCARSRVPSKDANSVHVMRICQALVKQGAALELIVPRPPVVSDNPYEYYGVKSSFAITYLRKPNIRFGVYIYSHRVLRWLKKDRNRCIYGRDFITCLFSSLSGFKTIWESHEPIEYMGRQYVFLFRQMLKKNNFIKIVVISSTLKEYYINKFEIEDSRISVLPDCSDIVDFNQVKPIDVSDKQYVTNVGYIGQLYPGKGMEIISRLVPLCPNVKFHIIGGKEQDLVKWKTILAKYNNVVFYGFIKPSDTAKYGMAMDVLIAPYMEKVQGARAKSFKQDLSKWMSPLKIFEYMSYRKPIIATDLPVLHDVLNEDNSIMCKPNDMEEWKRAILKLSQDKVYAEKLAKKAYEDFIANYTWDARAAKMIELFNNL